MNSGRGKAIQYARSNSVSKFRDIILDMCLHNRAVDPICEGTHVNYVCRLLEFLPDREFFADQILASLRDPEDDWDAVHRFCLARCLAEDGNQRARELLYKHYRPGSRFGDHIGSNFSALDGLPGFLFAAEKLGRLLKGGVPNIDFGLMFWRAGKDCGVEAMLSALREAATKSPEVEAFLNKAEAPHPSEPRLVGGFSDLPADSSRWQLRCWGEQTSAEELLLAAQAFGATGNTGLLPIFFSRPFPLDPASLLQLEHHRDAIFALEEMTHPEVRRLAFRLIETQAEMRYCAVDMLGKNLQPGDHEIALSWFLAETDPDFRHHMGFVVRLIAEEKPEVLRTLYEEGACGDCREWIVRDLMKMNALPEEFRLECADDSNETTRSICSLAETK